MTAGSLIDRALFQPMLAELRGKRVAVVVWNDGLAAVAGARATEQLLRHFDLRYRLYDHHDYAADRLLPRCDVIAIASGGCHAHPSDGDTARLEFLQSTGLPIVLMPPAEVAGAGESDAYHRLYVSDRRHLDLLPAATLAPDPLLGLTIHPPEIVPRFPLGVFLGDGASVESAGMVGSLGDPSRLCDSIEACAALACEFEEIVTDSIPMAVISLLCQRKVSLVAGDHGDIAGLYDALPDTVECRMPSDLMNIEYDQRAVEAALVEPLTGPRNRKLPMHAHPRRSEAWELAADGEGHMLRDPKGTPVRRLNAASGLIWSLCGGELGIGDMVTDLAEAYDRSPVETGRDVQAVLQDYFKLGAIGLDLEPEAGTREADAVQVSPPRVVRARDRRIPMRITVHEPCISHGMVHCHATLSHGDAEQVLWFRVNEALAGALTGRADPFLLSAVHHAMDEKASALWVEGAPVTRALLAAVDEFQRAWACWHADLVTVPLVVDEETDRPAADRPAVLCFSGGIDSCYSVYRHLLCEEPLRGPRVEAALMVHGFDIPLLDADGFQTALARSRRILDDVPLEILTMETNARNINLNWDRSHALGCAAALTLLGERFGTGLIASTFPYSHLRAGGSNPTTDWLLGSRYFEIRNDQAASTRLQKVLELVNWPHALKNTRFCWKDDLYGNCGRCSKCLVTAMMLRCAGAESLDCFESPLSDSSIAERLGHVKASGALERFDLLEIHRHAKARGLDLPWMPVLERRLGPGAPRHQVGQ